MAYTSLPVAPDDINSRAHGSFLGQVLILVIILAQILWLIPMSRADRTASPQVVLRFGHDTGVSQVLFSPDGGTVATLDLDSSVILWNSRTGVRLVRWQPVGTFLSQIQYSPDGAFLAAAGVSATIDQTNSVIVLINAHTGSISRTLTVTTGLQSDMTTFAWSPDAKSLVVGRRTAPAELWDVVSGTLQVTLPSETIGASSIAFSKDGKLFMTRFDTPPLHLPGAEMAPKAQLAWDAHTAAAAAVPSPPEFPAEMAGLTLLATGPSGRLVLGDQELQDVEFRGRILPGRRIVSTTPVFWNPADGRTIRGVKVAGALTNVRWAKAGTRVIAANRNTILLFDPYTGATTATFTTVQIPTTLAFLPDGGLVAAGEEDGSVAVFSTSVHGPDADHTDDDAPGNLTLLWCAPGRTISVKAIALSPNGALAVSAHPDGTLALWDLRAGRLVKALRLPGYMLVTVTWSPDSKTLATSQIRQARTATIIDSGVPPADVRLWDMPAMTLRKVIPGTDPRYSWSALAFSSDSSLLASIHDAGGMHLRGTAGDSDPAVLWDTKSGAMTRSLDGSFARPQAAIFDPTGRTLALSDANTFDLYDLPGFALRPSVALYEGGFTALTYTHDGQTLITGSKDGRVRFWPVTGTAEVREQGRYGKDAKTGLPAGSSNITGLTVSPDGLTVASGGADKTVRLWTIATGTLAATLPSQESPISALLYMPSGLLVTGGADGAIHIWDPTTQTLRATLTLLPSSAHFLSLPLPKAEIPAQELDKPVNNVESPLPQAPIISELNWIVWTPEGYYQASVGAGAFADWQQDGKSVLREVRRVRWNRPVLVRLALTEKP